MLQLKSFQIKNFRCFDQLLLDFSSPVILIEGANGTGKTTLLEALHYLCYLRSFRTHLPRDLIKFGHDSFFIKASFNNEIHDQSFKNEIQVGFSGKKRLVKINQKAINSYKELMDHYRIVTLTEDDLALIKNAPEVRRTFLDQALLLTDATFIATIRSFKQVVDNRNSMLQGQHISNDNYMLWTEQVWQQSQIIQQKRIAALQDLSRAINILLAEHFDEDLTINLEYHPKKIKIGQTLEQFLKSNPHLYNDEVRFRRSLFGAHLDDFIIKFQNKRSKAYASRGQQKLVILLIKIAQIKELLACKGPAIFLLDDFMADFDEKRAETVIEILVKLKCQLIFTSPCKGNFLDQKLDSIGAQRILLTI